MRETYIEAVGDTFYKVVSGQKRKFIPVRCICGKEYDMRYDTFGKHASCGCINIAECAARTKTHGKSKTKEYKTWIAMKSRCLNPDDAAWLHYGGNGIKVFEGWIDSFEAFYEAVGPCPDKSFSLDRINSRGNYEPGNVRWATVEQQVRNRRISTRNTTGTTGVVRREQPSGTYWVALCTKLNGENWFKTFSEVVYGSKAESLAIEYRKYMIEVLNQEGAGYTEGHGK